MGKETKSKKTKFILHQLPGVDTQISNEDKKKVIEIVVKTVNDHLPKVLDNLEKSYLHEKIASDLRKQITSVITTDCIFKLFFDALKIVPHDPYKTPSAYRRRYFFRIEKNHLDPLSKGNIRQYQLLQIIFNTIYPRVLKCYKSQLFNDFLHETRSSKLAEALINEIFPNKPDVEKVLPQKSQKVQLNDPQSVRRKLFTETGENEKNGGKKSTSKIYVGKKHKRNNENPFSDNEEKCGEPKAKKRKLNFIFAKQMMKSYSPETNSKQRELNPEENQRNDLIFSPEY